MDDFYLSVLKSIEEMQKEMSDSIKNILHDTSITLVDYSPKPSGAAGREPPKYAKGLFGNQWYFTYDSPSNELSSDKSMTGQDSVNRANKIKTDSNLFIKDFTFYAINNTDYSMKIEYEGWEGSKTAPYAPVGKTVALITAKYR